MFRKHAMYLLAGAVTLSMLTTGYRSARAAESRLSADELRRKITSLDIALFDAYNRCDLKSFERFLADDLELYHDQDGLVLGRQRLIDNVKRYVCGGDVLRELVPGTLRVHRIEGYGAICTGMHRFRHPRSKAPASERSFVNLWRYKAGEWQVTRSFSYDHRAMP